MLYINTKEKNVKMKSKKKINRRKKRKIIRIVQTVLAFCVTAAATLLSLTFHWVFLTWPNLAMDELIYTLNSPLTGTGTGMIWNYCKLCIIPTVAVILLLLICYFIYQKKHKTSQLVECTAMVLSLILLTVFAVTAWNRLDMKTYFLLRSEYSELPEKEYVNPVDVKLTFPEKKRNLIYIFLESMEVTYADEENGGAFRKNYIPELTELAQENEDFSGKDTTLNGGYAVGGTTWTMGAMFGQTSGLPLNIAIDGNEMDTQSEFFLGILTLGDLLESAGYQQTLMIGSDATFGGRKLYFTEHGNYDIFDYNYVIETGLLPEDYYEWWGYEDEKLFSYAKDKLLELAEQDEPFNLTLLTVDTHFEDGYVCELCDDEFGSDQYANVMACSGRQVTEFVKWIQEQDFYENTTIVISGDHPTMDSDFCEDVDESYGRKVYTAYINSVVASIGEKREYTTLDDFPTTLAALGVQIEGDRLGLGTNLFSETPTLLEKYGMEELSTELGKRSHLIDRLADIDEENLSLYE